MTFLRALAWLGLLDPCLIGDHHWDAWRCDTTPVPLFKTLSPNTQRGWEYVRITGPSYRSCLHCPALERKV